MKIYQIMSFLWDHGPEERVSIKEELSIILAHNDSNLQVALVGISLIQGVGC